MRYGLGLLRGVSFAAPIGAPIASSEGCRSSLWDGAFRRITPGALARLLGVLSSVVGGRA
jgi:hypothetical protein